MSDYRIPAGPGEAEFTEKRSRFLGHLRPVQSEEEARSFIAAMKKEYHDARHNCWCYALHNGPERYSDDGEPQGSAGLPMLEVFRRENVSDFVCVVTRYFGGVLLGTGGLLRAYTKSASDALDAAGLAELRRFAQIDLDCSYAALERMKLETAAAAGRVDSIDYGAQVALRCLIPAEGAESFVSRIVDLSGGSVAPRITGERLFPAPVER